MTDDKFGQKVGDTLLDPRNNRIWKGLLWLLAILLLVDVALGWYWSWAVSYTHLTLPTIYSV